jgi:hypothetical protein
MRKLTTESFIERAYKVHGSKYDYSKTLYNTGSTNIVIICPKHGEFLQLPSNHLSGSGCPKCIKKGTAPLTTDQFIKKALSKHGNRYDYSISDYRNNDTNIKIICRIHGEFEQIAGEHLRGRGCYKCNGGRKENLGLKGFIEKACITHGVKYDYSLVKYKNINSKVSIICPDHGVFQQRPKDHLKGSGCSECSKITTSKFIEQAVKLHGKKYDYSKMIYAHSCEKILIECSKHGEFFQTPQHHLDGAGCPLCARERTALYQSFTREQYIELAKKIHGERYIYTKVIYKRCRDIITITCPKHGDFKQRAGTHLEGQGCPICRKSKGEIKIEKWLRINNILYIPQAKFLDCRGKKYPLRFDFYLPEYAACIEFDGVQHFYSNSYFVKDKITAEKKLEDTKIYDNIKNIYCHKNSIKLIRIKYTQLKHDPLALDKILLEFKK